MKYLNKISPVLVLLVLVLALFTFNDTLAQCPMCKAAAESNLKEGGTHGAGLNTGILYLFFTPYIIIITLGTLWWWNNKKANQAEQKQQLDKAIENLLH